MVSTRAQAYSSEDSSKVKPHSRPKKTVPAPAPAPTEKIEKAPGKKEPDEKRTSRKARPKSPAASSKKRKTPEAHAAEPHDDGAETKTPETKKSRTKTPPKDSNEQTEQPISSTSTTTDQKTLAQKIKNPILSKLLSTYGALPLSPLNFTSPTALTPTNALAHLLNALLASTRISHQIAESTLHRLIRANYHDPAVLRASTWEQRTQLLTEGGYTHYREKTATELGELVELIDREYGGDATRLLEVEGVESDRTGKDAREEVARRLKAVKGLGPVGVDILFSTAQLICPAVAPFVAKRDLATARMIGLHNPVGLLRDEVGDDHVAVVRLCQALSTVRLEHKVGEFR